MYHVQHITGAWHPAHPDKNYCGSFNALSTALTFASKHGSDNIIDEKQNLVWVNPNYEFSSWRHSFYGPNSEGIHIMLQYHPLDERIIRETRYRIDKKGVTTLSAKTFVIPTAQVGA